MADEMPRAGEVLNLMPSDVARGVADGRMLLVDVREPYEFDAGHVSGSLNLPLSRFEPSQLPDGKPVVLICRSGVRSATAMQRARAAGVAEIRHYRGGVIGWANEGGELV